MIIIKFIQKTKNMNFHKNNKLPPSSENSHQHLQLQRPFNSSDKLRDPIMVMQSIAIFYFIFEFFQDDSAS